MTRDRWLRRLSAALLAISLLLLLAALPAVNQQQSPSMGIAFLAYAVVGWLVTRNRPRNPVGWVFLGVTVGGALLAFGNELTHLAFEHAVAAGVHPPALVEVPWWGWLGTWLNSWPYYVALTLMTTWTMLLFPDGLLSRRWRPVLWVSGLSLLGITALSMMAPTMDLGSYADIEGLCSDAHKACLGIANPLSPPFMASRTDLENSPAFGIGLVLFVGTLLLSVVCVILRFRRSAGIERLQLRWFALAAALLGATFVLQVPLEGIPTVYGDLIFSAVVSFVPIACGIAILRYRLYDIGRIISRTASYAIVTGLVLVTYALVVTSVSRVLGDSSTLAVAAATLAAAALVRPMLTRVQRVVDRRFNRERVDHEQAVNDFAARLRDQFDTERVGDELSDVVRRTLDPASLALFLRVRS
jgi:hypothetical protein